MGQVVFHATDPLLAGSRSMAALLSVGGVAGIVVTWRRRAPAPENAPTGRRTHRSEDSPTMDFGVNEEQRALLDSVDRMMAQHLPPEEVRRRDQAHEPPDFLAQALCRAWAARDSVPGNLRRPRRRVADGRRWRKSVWGITPRWRPHCWARRIGFGGMSVFTYGSEEQKKTLLPKIIAGDLRFSLGLTEPGAGTDAGALITRARRGDGGWIVNGPQNLDQRR